MKKITEYYNTFMEYFNSVEDIELYLILVLFFFTLWFILNTIKYFYGEKRKVKNLHRFAKDGDENAQGSLAHRYHKGDMVKKNCEQAAFWYQKAAFSGDEEARSRLKTFLEKRKAKKRKKC